MRKLRIDFSSENILPDGCFAGRMGEHNATEVTVIPSAEMADAENISGYCVTFSTGLHIIRSKVVPKGEELTFPLWHQLTRGHSLAVQLEAYDGEGELIVKSPVTTLKLHSSLCGEEAHADTDNPDLGAQVARNSEKLSKFSEDAVGHLLYNGEGLGNTGGIYVGAGLMPDGFNVQIDTDGEADPILLYTEQVLTAEEQLQARKNLGLDKEFELIDTFTLKVDALSITKHIDTDNNDFDFEELIIYGSNVAVTKGKTAFAVRTAKNWDCLYASGKIEADVNNSVLISFKKINGMWDASFVSSPESAVPVCGQVYKAPVSPADVRSGAGTNRINYIEITQPDGVSIQAGAVFEIWAVKSNGVIHAVHENE